MLSLSVQLAMMSLLLSGAVSTASQQKCDSDSDCPTSTVCRLLCKSSCESVCIDLANTRRKPPLHLGNARINLQDEVNNDNNPGLLHREPPGFAPNPPGSGEVVFVDPSWGREHPLRTAVAPPELQRPLGPIRTTPTLTPDYISTDPFITEKLDRSCPPAKVCGINCGIYIDERGCQGCQCMWISKACRADIDCYLEGQYCDLGRCQCGEGYEQDQERSGVCVKLLEPKSLPVLGQVREHDFYVDEVPHGFKSDFIPFTKVKREAALPKLTREERLQWPGPCNDDSECPPNLYCLNSDCWHIPDKPLRQFRQEESDEDNDHPTIKINDGQQPGPPGFQPDESKTEPDSCCEASPTDPQKQNATDGGRLGLDDVLKRTQDKEKEIVGPLQVRGSKSPPHLSRSSAKVTENDGNEPQNVAQPFVDVPLSNSMTSLPDIDSSRIFMDYSRQNRQRKPVRVEGYGTRGRIQDECQKSAECGHRMKCCPKRWCDLGGECGTAKFCLPNCQLTKVLHMTKPNTDSVHIDFIYD